jgi:AraC-like DNA-binding protein
MKEKDFFSSQVFRARIFRRNLGPQTSGGLTIVYGGCEHCSADYKIDRRSFPYWCIELVVAGRGELIIGNQPSVILESGAIFVYGPGISYRMLSDPAKPLVKYFVDFKGSRALSLLRKANFPPGTSTHVFPPAAVAEIFDRLIDAGLDPGPNAPRRTALILEDLILGCADWRIPHGASQSVAYTTFRRCRDIIDGLDRKGTVIRSIAATARACHINSAYLSRLFQRFARMAPHQYLTRLRMEAVTARLLQPDSLIKEVAEEFGFADPYHFSRAFKRFHGIAPSEFRARLDPQGREQSIAATL